MNDFERQIRECHEAYCAAVGVDLPLRFGREADWARFLQAGFTPADLRLVVRWIRKQIASNSGGYSETSLRFTCLVRSLDYFEERLALAKRALGSGRPVSSAPPEPEPPGWREYLIERYPSAKIPRTFRELSADIRRECKEAVCRK